MSPQGETVRIFITGHRGQLGRALWDELGSRHELVGGDLSDWDMTDRAQAAALIVNARPDVVIHAAALTNVEYCAEHPAEAVRANGVGTYNVALACRDADARLIAISTNEVFDGQVSQPYQEYDPRHPINPYGYSKYVAEQVVERYAPHYAIVRTAWLFAPGGVNFIHKILARARSGQPLPPIRKDLGEAAHFLWLMTGEEPTPDAEHTLDVSYVLHAEHGFNASTFTGRAVASTLSDM